MNRRNLISQLLFACAALYSFPALAQYSLEQQLLGGFQLGFSVSLSADGNTAISGAFPIGGGAGYVWDKAGNTFGQPTKLFGSGAIGNAQQGWSVALSADGNTALVGGNQDDNGTGAAWVWVRNGSGWVQQGTKLVGSGSIGLAQQGFAVSLSADGNTALIGGEGDNANAGAAWIWTRTNGVWTQQGSKLVGSGATINSQQGWSVALSADASTAIVGGLSGSATGAGWIWTNIGGAWTQQGPKLIGAGSNGFSLQGTSVSISASGNTAVVGGSEDDSKKGAAWIWIRSSGVWTQQGPKLVGTGAIGAAQQGQAVSLSADGNTALVAGPGDAGGNGAAWIWKRSQGVWSEQGAKIVASPSVSVYRQQGWSACLSGDGRYFILGAPSGTGGSSVFILALNEADIAIAHFNVSNFVSAGSNLNYTIVATNNGPSPATSVVVSDVIPADTTLLSATSTQGSCTGTQAVSCALGTLPTGGSATISLVVKTASTPGPVSNTATVTATELDPNTTNNSSTSAITTVDPAMLPVWSDWMLIVMAGMLAMMGAMRTRN